jgi:electron transfer flavoprotein beta subunit
MSTRGPMTIAVLIKQVPDMNAIRIDRTSGRIVPSAQLVMSSYDGYAVEAALRLKESFGGEVVAVGAGPAPVKDVLTRALAMGTDRAIHVQVPDVNAIDTLGLARALCDAVAPLGCNLVLAGQASDDVETGQVGAQVAALLGLPVVSNVVSFELDGNELRIVRDMEDGFQTVRATLPAVLLSSTGLDEPRLPSLKGIMAAKKKPTDVVAASPDGGGRLTWDEPYVPEKPVLGTIVQDVPAGEAARQLVAWLREQKLI